MESLVHILHLEDDPADAELIQTRIEETIQPCRITRARTSHEFDEALHRGKYDIILADFQLPMYDGMSALRLVKKLRPDIPFIFVSGTMGEDAAIEGLTEGATDYVLKQKLSRLPSAIKRALLEAENRRERQRAEEELRKLSRAVEQSANSILITDIQGYIEYANPKFAEISGYSLAETIGQHTRMLKSDHTSPEEYRHLWETITAGKEWRGEFYNRRKSGELYWESASISPIKNADGVITHFLAVKEDITARKRAEDTRTKLEAQLRQSQKMESIGRLAGGVAHDFNNLLTVIQGYSALLRPYIPIEGPGAEMLEQVQQASERAAILTRQLLIFSRQQVLTPTSLNLNDLVTNLHKMLGRLIGEDILLTTDLQPELWPIVADPGQIEQVIMNLVINARDAMTTGGKLTIQTGNVHLDNSFAEIQIEAPIGPCIMLTVTDTGCGMDELTRTHIFEPFFTTKESGKGTGLGLSTVYGIVKQSGGHITVYSEPGQGTTFKIYLPAGSITSPADPSNHQTQPVIHSGNETILLVEDDEMLRSLMLWTLQDQGYILLEASSGDEALSLANQHPEPIDLLLTDIVMPQMGGRELAKRLGAIRPRMKVLFMSGYTDDTIVQQGLVKTRIEFLPKPFSPDMLASKVREVFDK